MLFEAILALAVQDYSPAQEVPGWRFQRSGGGCQAIVRSPSGTIFGVELVSGADRVSVAVQHLEMSYLDPAGKYAMSMRIVGPNGAQTYPDRDFTLHQVGRKYSLVGRYPSDLLDSLADGSTVMFRLGGSYRYPVAYQHGSEGIAALRQCAATAAGARTPAPAPSRTAAPARDPAVAPKPIAPARWITNADYPKGSAERGESGTVEYRLLVAPDGTVTQCGIVESTGSWRLDSTTCRVLRERARFEPAKDENDRPVAGIYRGSFRWRLAN